MAISDDLLKLISTRGAAGSYVSSGGGGGGGGGGGSLTGAAPRNYNAASGGIPGVTSPIDTVTGNLGGISDIINSITSSQSGALKGQYPSEYFNVLGTLLGNTQRRASGDISDLLPELQQNTAERAVSGGISGSGLENTKLLRDIGLTRYGVENQALRDLGTIQGEIPTVHPFDPNAIIGQQLNAQERADMYAAAPSPEAAYQRALSEAGGGGGATPSWKSSGVSFAPTGGGGVPAKPQFSPWRATGPVAPQFGSAMNPFGGSPNYASAPYGTYGTGGGIPGSSGPADNYDDILSLWNDNTDFGGGNDYGGGAAWQPFGDSLDLSGDQNYGGGFNDWLTTDYEPVDYSDPYYW